MIEIITKNPNDPKLEEILKVFDKKFEIKKEASGNNPVLKSSNKFNQKIENNIIKTLYLHNLQNYDIHKLASDIERFDYFDQHLPEINYKVLNLKELKTLSNKKNFLLAADIETTGFDFKRDTILALGIQANLGQTFIIPEKLIYQHSDLINKLFINNKFIWHNGKFDIKFFRQQLGIKAKVDEDTMLLNHNKWNNTIPNDLKFLSKKYFNDYFYGDIDYNNMENMPKDKFNQYLAKDCEYTLRIYNILKENKNFAYKNIMIPLSNVLAEIELQGMKLNMTHLKQVERKYVYKTKPLLNKIDKKVKEYGFTSDRYLKETEWKSCSEKFNPDSWQQLEYLFYDLMKFDYKNIPLKSKTGKDTREYLINSMNECIEKEIIKLIHKYKKHRGLYTKAIKPFLKGDSILNTTYNIHGTASGRLSSTDPNFQNIPRKKDVKNIFISRENFKIVEADYSQAELRTLGIVSKDKYFEKIYKNNEDLHDKIAELLFGKGFTYEQRQKAKTLNFGIGYGLTPYNLAIQFNMKQEEADKIYKDWFNNLKEAGGWLKNKRENIHIPITTFERKRLLPIVNSKNKKNVENEIVNHYIQSTAADLTNLSLIKIYNKVVKNNPEIYIINTVHDSIIFEIKEGKVNYYVKQIKKIMEEIPEKYLGDFIPFKVDIEKGYSWGDLK